MVLVMMCLSSMARCEASTAGKSESRWWEGNEKWSLAMEESHVWMAQAQCLDRRICTNNFSPALNLVNFFPSAQPSLPCATRCPV